MFLFFLIFLGAIFMIAFIEEIVTEIKLKKKYTERENLQSKQKIF
jgi:hypothetical protein